jgi:hypothetical protein
VSRAALLLLACISLLAACGEEPDDPPPVFDVKAPRGERTAEFPRAGMTLTRPRNWRLRRRDAPGVFELVSGEAIIAGWAYRREEPLPETDADLEAAKDRLLDAIEERNPEYEIREAVLTDIAGAPAIDIEGEQVLSKRMLRTRSVHVFDGETEYVIEAIAPPADYALVEEKVMTPLLDSLEVEGVAPEDTG